jgi:hypothetical protein
MVIKRRIKCAKWAELVERFGEKKTAQCFYEKPLME